MSCFPEWKDMPESQAIVTLSWEDVYYKAEPITQEEFGRDPTKDEIKELFHHILHKGIDMEDGTFWGSVEVLCQEYYDEVKR